MTELSGVKFGISSFKMLDQAECEQRGDFQFVLKIEFWPLKAKGIWGPNVASIYYPTLPKELQTGLNDALSAILRHHIDALSTEVGNG